MNSALSLIKQQSKAEWIGLGDDSSRYFMAKIKQRKAMTNLPVERQIGHLAVADTISDFYKGLLGQQEIQSHHIDPQQQINLCKPFKETEIKQALFSIPSFKSPRPDGYNSGFFRASWQHTANEIWKETLQDWGIKMQVDGLEQCRVSMKKLKGTRQISGSAKAIINAVLHHIWQARNFLIFEDKTQAIVDIVRSIREQFTHRILHLHPHSHSYTQCMDFLFSRHRQ
ncbi:hypothetical protein Cgig2_017422 [Carnegiea gigantea]|uniref:Uncharacterized protein n=1 Tax=Carnegiea gigantea TaxID=171969 RepID=A0A9Q1JVA0_9CARY|nr:hypothetical protein Cgig2_017422 [Carnegiea gigantea]